MKYEAKPVAKKYLASTTINRYTPAINHGIVDVNDSGFIVGGVNDGVPIEDFGAFILRDRPFPDNQQELDQLFLDLRSDNE